MNEMHDQASPVREGEELDGAKLEPYVRKELGIAGGAFEVEQFPGGHSNLTYLVRLDSREIVLRRPPFGSKVKSAHDMGREYTILSHIHEAYPPAPKPLFYCEDEEILGAKFYAMERMEGVIFRVGKPNGLDVSEEQIRDICVAHVNNLADLHSLDWQELGLASLRKPGAFVERQVLGWDKRYAGSQTHDIPGVEEVFTWVKERIPEDTGAVLIHNDYKFDNMMLDPNDVTKIVGLLDWEMSTIGDPMLDLGVTLGYWPNRGEMAVSTSRCFVNDEVGSITRREYADLYAERTGRDVSNLFFYYAFAVIKLAVVLQQIYYRYHHGLTKDERFAGLIEGVRMLAQQAEQIIEAGEL